MEEENVSIVVISEIIPRINGGNFRDILIYLQPITSKAFSIPISINNFGKNTFWSSLLFPVYFQSNGNMQAFIFSSLRLRIISLGSLKTR